VIMMAAPNGARKTHKDHASLPISIAETVDEAVACYAAGATVLHAHVRGQQQQHVLDAGLYIELVGELKRQVPEMLVQITTEAVGVYTPRQQAACVKKVNPEMASVSLREITGDFHQPEYARDFYQWCVDARIHVQHILFSTDELEKFHQYKSQGIIPESQNCVLFVLGRYAIDFQSTVDYLKPFLQHDLDDLDWFSCAFGLQEQACVLSGIKHGGHARIGFENNLHLPNGELASSTHEQVLNLKDAIERNNGTVADSTQSRRILGLI
ncbi:MAG: 3-keto-5-aminohexanoate cleavage protein, partial [Gammaproteobacteria bacterium]|nr:3-keto-5-aminohexanoate cleavage protein [Gammaproteobacteria bacterium]